MLRNVRFKIYSAHENENADEKIIILITCVEPLFERYRYLSGFLEEEDVSERNGFVESSGVAVGVIAFTHNTSGWSC